MFWGSKKEEPSEAPEPAKRKKLSPQLQKIVDSDDDFYSAIYSPYDVDSNDTPYRYAAYATRLRTLLLASHRYIAYTSDLGESFRPVAHPYLVRSAYGISWAYILGDVAHEGYKGYLRNRRVLAPPCEAYKDSTDLTHQQIMMGMATGNVAGSLSPANWGEGEKQSESDTLTPWPQTNIPLIEDYRVVMAKRAIFQGIASMGLPALTIHSVVKYSGRALKGAQTTFLRTYVPIGLGLSVVPFLPYVFDHPVDQAVDWTFRTGLRIYGGEDAIKPLPRHSKAAQAPTEHEEDSTSLSHFHIKAPEVGDATSAKVSWDEYKDERQRAKERRKREREERGESSGILAMLGFGSVSKQSEGKGKTE
ncbi:mitochondrial fission process 1 family protein [Aspergillus mulundensis]|uniref:Mitochondrial fission process protein 1 n=1 Tax=Aspergillus mulundensis TaxID=1810919 RepID=A0A3D8QZC0_9EURO|nr:Uncharacterized protein DSM5745_09029 [Aspergillus mulundensis]RDW67163.1 Uncharacterized protein DSM5745_09029 [Aspergillus mulundensis]